MLRLTAIRLINWYHYTDEAIRVVENTLLCGDNGSGKTTVLDALQLALVGDASECEFNRAAQTQARGTIKRSVLGYVRFQTGDTDDARPGRWEYARESGTTGYIALEFRDHDNPELDFTCGLVIDAKESTFDKAYFIMPGEGIAAVPALTAAGEVRPIREFRAAARALDVKLPVDARSYRGEIRHRLGHLPESFHRLIVKALEFKPMSTVRDFVFRYLADAKPIDSQPLIDNIEHYRQMDREAKDAEVKIADLAEICHKGDAVLRDRRLVEQYNFLALRAGIDMHALAVADIDRRADAERVALDRAKVALQIARDRVKVYQDEKEKLIRMLANSAAQRRITQLKADLARVQRDIHEAEEAEKQLRDAAATQLAAMDALTSPEACDARRLRSELFGNRTGYGEEKPSDWLPELRERLTEDGGLRGHDLGAWERRTGAILEQLTLAKSGIAAAAVLAKDEGRELANERDTLAQGHVQYPEGARGLIQHIQRNLKGTAPARVLAEVIDVRNERWREALEAALGARRLYILVDQADYSVASRMYDSFRKAGNRVFGTGVVDLERVYRDARRARPGSLAEQVISDDPDARAYVDYLLGDMICVDTVAELRKHSRSITDTGATYGSAAMSNTDPRALDRRYIGRAARERRLQEIESRLSTLSQELVTLNGVADPLDRHLRLFRAASQGLRTIEVLLPQTDQLPTLREHAAATAKTIAGIDRGADGALEEQLELTSTVLGQAGEALESAIRGENERVSSLAELGRQRAAATEARETAEHDWRSAFPLDRLTHVELGSADDPWREHEHRYLQERSEREPAEIRNVFVRREKEFATRIANGVASLREAKAKFNVVHYEVTEPSGDGFAAYREQKIVWEESKLPEYRKEIAKAQQLAVRQMGEDIVCRLHENFMQLKLDIRDLNRALKDLTFGADRFEFRLETAPDKRDYYDVITRAAAQPTSAPDAAEQSLFDGQQPPAENLTTDLTRLVDEFLQARSEQVKTKLEEITDYREYFTYDLRITNVGTGKGKSYDTVAGVGSGGEVQSALYIAFLASLYQMYRSNTRDHRPRCGLVLLDEAFGKNDGRRIAATLKFARKFGLQLLLAMPAERMDLLGPQMDTTLYLYKNEATGAPLVMDFTKEFDSDALAAAKLAVLEAEDLHDGDQPVDNLTPNVPTMARA